LSGDAILLNPYMDQISDLPQVVSHQIPSCADDPIGGCEAYVEQSKSFTRYVSHAVQILHEHDLIPPDVDRVTLIVQSALAAQSLFFSASLHHPEQAELHLVFEAFQVLTSEILVNAMAEWIFQNVTMKFNFTTEVCKQARFQIMHGLLDPYRVKATATSFNGLMKELRPVEFSDDSGALISDIAGWLLGCLLATGQKPVWMYGAFGAAGNRVRQMEEKARYDKWATTLDNGSQIAAIRA
jgi:hypothetical protein